LFIPPDKKTKNETKMRPTKETQNEVKTNPPRIQKETKMKLIPKSIPNEPKQGISK